MLFVEFRFFIFFAVIFAVHWALRTNTARKCWLLMASHVFYACFFIGNPVSFVESLFRGEFDQLPQGWWFPAVLWASTCMDFAVGLGMANSSSETRRKAWLFASLLVNLGALCFFKYVNFFIISAGEFLGWLGLPSSPHTLNIILPYGVSFYTFQSMSYSIDVYRRRLEPIRHFLDLAFFIAFFPQLVAGPIVRAITFLPQVFEKRVLARVDFRGCFTLFFIGFFKKACVSELVAPFSDGFFAAPHQYSHVGALLGVFFYAVQIYCDFSGYSDMAIASARLLGYELTPNFAWPYFAANITEFWRRWHMSLSTWLRDYLYISLGGNRGTKLFTYRNLMLTMLLGGLWHGASWNFIIWGGMHGCALIAHREWTRVTVGWGGHFQRAMSVVAVPLTFYWICVTWIFFRAAPTYNSQTNLMEVSGLENAWRALQAFSFIGKCGKTSFGWQCAVVLLALALVHWLSSRQWLANYWRRLPGWACAALLGVGVELALLLAPVKYKPFIYFQF